MNWNKLTANSGVTSVNGMTGVVTLSAGNSYLSGKKIVGLGDSITAGANPANEVNFKTWLQIMNTNYGCTSDNQGMSGCTLANNGNSNSMVLRYSTLNPADIVIIWGGWNDINQNIPLGTSSDAVDNTFYGALNIILNGIQNNFTGKKIFICTIMDTLHSYTTVKSFNDAIRDRAEYYMIPIIEMAKVGFSARNTTVKNALLPDGTHPNLAGNTFIADVIGKFINSH